MQDQSFRRYRVVMRFQGESHVVLSLNLRELSQDQRRSLHDLSSFSPDMFSLCRSFFFFFLLRFVCCDDFAFDLLLLLCVL